MMTIVIENTKTKLVKEMLVSRFDDLQINEILWFYNNVANKDYKAWIKE